MNEISISQLVRALFRDKWLFAAVVLVIFVVSLGFSFLITPTYRAETLLMPSDDGRNESNFSQVIGRLGGLASLAGIDGGGGGISHEALAIIRSRTFTYDFLESQQLLPKLYSGRWNQSEGSWDVEDSEDIPTLEDGYRLFHRDLFKVSIDGDTGFVTAAIEWKDPSQAAGWINELIKRLNIKMREKAIRESEKSITFLNKELGATSVVELQNAIYGLIENQINKIMLANVREEFAFKVLDPAIVPAQDDYVWPNRPLIAVGSLMLGIILGGMIVIFRAVLATEPA